MYGKPGEFFFHYTRAATAFELILPSGQLRLSSYRLMRDPLEAQPWSFGASHWGEEIDESSAVAQLFERSDLANQLKGLAKLLSLSVDAPSWQGWQEPFGRGYARASMWELYAERHEGACLLFDRARLIEVLMPQLESKGEAFHNPVGYEVGVPEDPGASVFGLGSDPEPLSPMEAVRRHLAQHRKALFFTKLADWAGECEYRFVVIGEPGDHLYCEFEDSLRAVIVGRNFPDWQLDGAMRVAADADAEFRQLDWRDGFPRPAKPRGNRPGSNLSESQIT